MKNNLREILKNMHDKYVEDLIDYDSMFEDAKENKRHNKLLKKQKQHNKNKRNSSTDKQQWLDADGPQTD